MFTKAVVKIYNVSNDIYSVVEMELTFKRLIVSNLIGVYGPTILIVLMCYCSVYISLDAVGCRTNLCVTSFLALVTQFATIRKDLPTVSYINVIAICPHGV